MTNTDYLVLTLPVPFTPNDVIEPDFLP